MKLSEFKGEKAFEIAAKIMPLARDISRNEKVREAMKADGMTYTGFLTGIAQHAQNEAAEIFAVLNEIDVEEYKAKATAATIISDLYSLLYDDELMRLFGLAAPNLDKTSSTAATTKDEAAKA